MKKILIQLFANDNFNLITIKTMKKKQSKSMILLWNSNNILKSILTKIYCIIMLFLFFAIILHTAFKKASEECMNIWYDTYVIIRIPNENKLEWYCVNIWNNKEIKEQIIYPI